jgi:hypothetical protein
MTVEGNPIAVEILARRDVVDRAAEVLAPLDEDIAPRRRRKLQPGILRSNMFL